MYFIDVGTVTFKNYDDIIFQSLKDGSYFGEIEIIDKYHRYLNDNKGYAQHNALPRVNYIHLIKP